MEKVSERDSDRQTDRQADRELGRVCEGGKGGPVCNVVMAGEKGEA